MTDDEVAELLREHLKLTEGLRVMIERLHAELFAHRVALDSLVQTHPDLEAYLEKHHANMHRLDGVTQDQRPLALERALAMHRLYRRQ